jgi:hypothetical protein
MQLIEPSRFSDDTSLGMPEVKEGSFELDFGVVKLGAKLSEDDSQCAWELYTGIVCAGGGCRQPA